LFLFCVQSYAFFFAFDCFLRFFCYLCIVIIVTLPNEYNLCETGAQNYITNPNNNDDDEL